MEIIIALCITACIPAYVIYHNIRVMYHIRVRRAKKEQERRDSIPYIIPIKEVSLAELKTRYPKPPSVKKKELFTQKGLTFEEKLKALILKVALWQLRQLEKK